MVNDNNSEETEPWTIKRGAPGRKKSKKVVDSPAPEESQEHEGVDYILKKFEEQERDDPDADLELDPREKLELEAKEAKHRYEESLSKLEEYDAKDPKPAPPGFWRAFAGTGGVINVFAWLGFVFTFVFFPLGFIFSGIALVNARGRSEDKLGKVLAWIGFILSTIGLVFLLVTFLWLLFAMISNAWYFGAMPVEVMAPGPYGR